MRKLFLISYVFFFIWFLQSNIAFSTDCEPCDDTCNWQAPYNPPYSYGPENSRFLTSGVTYGNSTCYFAVKFKMSECYCPQLRRELLIESIELFGGGDCNNITREMIIQRAIQQLLYESSINFNINNPSQPFDIVIKLPSCMKKTFFEVSPDCTPQNCCETVYTLQHTNGQGQPPNSVIVLDKTTNDPEVNCSGSSQSTCQNICETNDVALGPLFPDYQFSCPSDDPCNTDWDTRPKVQSFTIGNCTFAAFFYTRDNCYDYSLQRYLKEIKIQKVVLVNPGCSPLPSNETILNTAWRKILKNPGRWFNNDERILIHTRVYECWININNRLLLPCNQYACCSHSYWIFRTGTYPDYIYTTRRQTEDPNDPLATYDLSSENCENGCSNFCEASFVGYDIDLKGVEISYEDLTKEIDQMQVQIKSKIIDYALIISLFSNVKADYELFIFDLLGNQIKFFKGQTKLGLIDFKFDLAELQAGLYFYYFKIISKEYINKAGKFYIIK